MRVAFALMLFGLSVPVTGCRLVADGARNTVQAIRTPIEEHHETTRNRRWAESAWVTICSAAPASYSMDHADGFKEGYAEYLYRGGDGEPPLLPPLRYRKVKYQTPEGFTSIQDWFSGYRHGAAVARDSGARQWIIGPSALSAAPHVSVEEKIQIPPGVILPPPRPEPTIAPIPAAPVPLRMEQAKFPPANGVQPPALPSVVLPAREASAPAPRLRLIGIRAAAITNPSVGSPGTEPPAPTPRLRIIGIRAGLPEASENQTEIEIIQSPNEPTKN